MIGGYLLSLLPRSFAVPIAAALGPDGVLHHNVVCTIASCFLMLEISVVTLRTEEESWNK